MKLLEWISSKMEEVSFAMLNVFLVAFLPKNKAHSDFQRVGPLPIWCLIEVSRILAYTFCYAECLMYYTSAVNVVWS